MQPTPKSAARQLVTEAKQRIENLTPDQVAAELERGDVLLADLREADERAQKGGIAGAVHAAPVPTWPTTCARRLTAVVTRVRDVQLAPIAEMRTGRELHDLVLVAHREHMSYDDAVRNGHDHGAA